MLPITARAPRAEGEGNMPKKSRKPSETTVRWVNPPDQEALLAFERALARVNARLDVKAEDWRKRPRKRVLKPKKHD
jgi:hypothetical protein